MNEQGDNIAKRLRGGWSGPVLILLSVLLLVALLWFYFGWAHFERSYGKKIPFNKAMFGPAIAQPISFSHRLHVTDKKIDCYYCHSFAERSLNAGIPSVNKCLGCHNYIIPEHEEIKKLKSFASQGGVPWTKVYYKPDHVFFPHYRHINKGLKCQQCHGEVERVDRLRQVTFYMGFCLKCHRKMKAPLDCWACHQ